jgi:hypothetical protein
MKYLKLFELFETGQLIDYEKDDIVVCIKSSPARWYKGELVSALEVGKQYIVVNLYQIPEDKYLGNKFLRVDVRNIETREISRGWESTRFKSELEFNADKYNM